MKPDVFTYMIASVNKQVRFSITVFFPCYNDEKSIAALVRDAFAILPTLTRNYEVIVVDDASTDTSRYVLQQMKKKYPALKLIYHTRNRGYGGALRTGFQKATKDVVFYTDGDGQYDVKELPLMVSLMTPDVNFINGIKIARSDPSYRIIIGDFYSFVVRWLFWLKIVDVDCDFRLIRRSLLKKITLSSTSGSICVELVKKAQRAGAVFRQVSIHHYERRFGISQFFRPDRILTTFWEVASLWVHLMIADIFVHQ